MDNIKYSEILELKRSLAKEINGVPYRVRVLSNVTINSIKEILEFVFLRNQINPLIEIGNYDNIMQDSAMCSDYNLVIVVYNAHNIVDSLSCFMEDVDNEFYTNLKLRIFAELDIIFENLNNCPAVIFNMFSSKDFVTSFSKKAKIELLVSELNSYVEEKHPISFTLVDTDKIILQIGSIQSFDQRQYHSSKAPYSLAFLKTYVSAIEPIILRYSGKLKKAIIFDCDNTLWKGILGEDGSDKIDMSGTSSDGKIYRTVQQIAVYLSKNGVIVGLCSKNNEEDINELILNHPDLVLKDEYLTIKKVNWEDKASNLKLIASELNIGLESIVFVDDSSFEINLVKEQIPEILTMQVPSSIYDYPNALLKLVYKYFYLSGINEDTKKTEIYKLQFQRENEKKKFESIDEYLSSLSISMTIYKDDQKLIPRIAQLTQKTNQFNLTTRRYTESQILTFMQSSDSKVFAFSVNDKFGENGLTGVCILNMNPNEVCNVFIDTLLMSCRIIGRNIEFAFMDYLTQWLLKNKYQSITADYNSTKKNRQVESYYDGLGFELINRNNEHKQYKLILKEYKRRSIEYIKVESKIDSPV